MKNILHSPRLITAALALFGGTVHAAVVTVQSPSPGLGTLLRWFFGL